MKKPIPARNLIVAIAAARESPEFSRLCYAALQFGSTPAEIAAALSVYRRVKAKRKKRKRP